MPFQDTLKISILDRITAGTATDGFPGNIYIGLATNATAPLESETTPVTNEITGVDTYERVLIGTGGTNWNGASIVGTGEAETDNINEILMPEASASWGTIEHALLFDSLTGGVFLGSGSISSTAVGAGDQLRFKANTIVLKLT